MLTPDASKPKPAIVPKSWQNGLGPYYVGLFLWVVFFDQLGLRALTVGGLGASVLGVVVAGPICYLLFFRVPAIWGYRTGKPLPELASSTFGAAGSRWVPGLLLGLAEIVWFAVAVSYGTDLVLRALNVVGLVDARALRPLIVGKLVVKSPLFLITSLTWAIWVALIGRYLVRLIAAIMYIFPVFPGILLGGTMLAMLGGLRSFTTTGADPLGFPVPRDREVFWSLTMVAQLVLGFFAMAGAYGADWGAASTSEGDVKKGGWVAVCLAPIVIATLALLSVAGFQGRLVAPNIEQAAVIDPYADSFRKPGNLAASQIDTRTRRVEASFRSVVSVGIGGKVGCAMLLIFGAAALAPATYSSYVFGNRLHAAFSGLSRTNWTLVGIVLAWPLVALGTLDRLDRVFNVMGALFAPLIGCIAAEYARHKGVWPGPRKGWNLPGLIGWTLGLAVGLLPMLGGRLAWFQPAAFWAFVVAFVAYRLAAATLGEAKPIELQPQGAALTVSTSLPTAVTISDSTDSAQGEGSP
jgi:cytosine permease